MAKDEANQNGKDDGKGKGKRKGRGKGDCHPAAMSLIFMSPRAFELDSD